ncbi:hypothetical protein SDC9_185749 [bioreactor metagenome]|uniref:Uncharacterized protein n=1 Tax=bioreactor metagenome TaxID=1076179 RepID=A0A645HGQ4_9ZZZZ
MRAGQVEDILRRAMTCKDLQHLAAEGVLDAGGQLAIREGARAAFAELHVALGVQDTL